MATIFALELRKAFGETWTHIYSPHAAAEQFIKDPDRRQSVDCKMFVTLWH